MMPITFDTLDELKAFYQHFRLTGSASVRGLGSTTKKSAPKNTSKKLSATSQKSGRTTKKVGKASVASKTVKTAKVKSVAKASAKSVIKTKTKAKVAAVQKAVKSASTKKPLKSAAAPKINPLKKGTKAPSKNGKVKAVKAVAAARPKGRPKSTNTLTSKILATIQDYVKARREFTANDIYATLSKKEKGVNKQSVITSVLKQMNGQFKHVNVKERAGLGPRPVKVYHP